jgi:hypothetical protein
MKDTMLEDDPDCDNAYAVFGIRSPDLAPAEVTKDIGLEPSHSLTRGDPISERPNAPKRPWGVWQLSTEAILGNHTILEHAEYLLAKLEPKAEAISRYRMDDRYYVGIHIYWHSKYLEGGFTLPAITVLKLSKLCNYIDFGFIVKRAGRNQ